MGNNSIKKPQLSDQHPHQELKNAYKTQHKECNVIEVHFPISTSAQFIKWSHCLSKKPSLKCPNAFLPIETTMIKESLCGNNYLAKNLYPDYQFLLSDQIKKRRKLGKKNQETQLWFLIYALSQTASNYHRYGMKVGDIRPANILLNEKGQIKTITQHSFPRSVTNYQKTTTTLEKTYLSPEEYEESTIGMLSSSHDIQTSEAFSIGLTVMDCILLEDSYCLYKRKGAFDAWKLHNKKQKVINSLEYTKTLKILLFNLTDIIPEKRLKCRELKKWLSHNKFDIINSCRFHPEIFPEKLKKAERDFESFILHDNSNNFQNSSENSQRNIFQSRSNDSIRSQSLMSKHQKSSLHERSKSNSKLITNTSPTTQMINQMNELQKLKLKNYEIKNQNQLINQKVRDEYFSPQKFTVKKKDSNPQSQHHSKSHSKNSLRMFSDEISSIRKQKVVYIPIGFIPHFSNQNSSNNSAKNASKYLNGKTQQKSIQSSNPYQVNEYGMNSNKKVNSPLRLKKILTSDEEAPPQIKTPRFIQRNGFLYEQSERNSQVFPILPKKIAFQDQNRQNKMKTQNNHGRQLQIDERSNFSEKQPFYKQSNKAQRIRIIKSPKNQLGV